MLRALSPEETIRTVVLHRPEVDEEQARLLAALSEGRPGIALALLDQGGIELFRTMLSLLGSLPKLDVPELHSHADKLAQGGGSAFGVFTSLLAWWLARFVRFAVSGQPVSPELIPREGELVARLAAGAPLDRWCEVWERVARLVAQAEGLNLDRRQVLLDIFFGLQATFRPAA